MDRVVHFAATAALALAGIIILGPGGASILSQYSAGQVAVLLKARRSQRAALIGSGWRRKPAPRPSCPGQNNIQPER
jgi:hypothetical protein